MKRILVMQPLKSTTRRHRNNVLNNALEYIDEIFPGETIGVLSTAIIDNVDFTEETPIIDYDGLMRQVDKTDVLYLAKGWRNEDVCTEVEQLALDRHIQIIDGEEIL